MNHLFQIFGLVQLLFAPNKKETAAHLNLDLVALCSKIAQTFLHLNIALILLH